MKMEHYLAHTDYPIWEVIQNRNGPVSITTDTSGQIKVLPLIRNFDDIKARIEADILLAEKLQEQEREQFTIEERAKFLHDTIVAQRKFLAQQRSEAIRNRPPTKNQLRNQMMTYLKRVGNFIFSYNKGESSVQRDPLFDEIPEDTVDHMDTENAQDEGRTREIVDEDKEIEENVLSTEDVLNTDKEEVSTDRPIVSTDRPIVSTDGSK
ncbi:hypothetical protein Tco_1267746, partial [Tanacetum coccineum]